ncbi:MAG TPA: TolC family protein, partial [Anaeromyxobacteraceae bacterium]|nr:TolC family protein [Anaeromyxobacteraceae bacterium]
VRVTLPTDSPAASLDAEGLAGEALSLRPELRARTAQVLAAENQLDSARWRWAPQISASGSLFAQNVPYPTGHQDGWRVTVDLVWPLYDGGYRYGKASEARAALAGAEAARDLTRLQVGQEVQDAVRDVTVAGERVRLGERQQEAAAEAAASARRSFAAGVAGSIDVVDANDRLFQAEVGLADARARLGTARVALDRAVGRSP